MGESEGAESVRRFGLVALDPQRFPADGLVNDVRARLDSDGAVVVVAPPGTGKTTRLPLHLTEPGTLDRLIITEPRRVATRAAAERMALTLGEPVGETVGYRMRDETKVSARTRIEVVTEGVFLRMLQNDPGLEGVSTVLFDEVHERSLDIDLSLTLAAHAKSLLRPELRLIAMSATLESERFAELLGASVVATESRTFPLHVREKPTLIAHLADGVVDELQLVSSPGDVLVFLPGTGEIRAVQRVLRRRPLRDGVVVHTLTGSTAPDDVALALRPDPYGRQKVILATAVAQTSITIPGVRTVVDSGLTRRSSFDPRTGLSRLVTERTTKATARQRAGRAGREAPGVVIRMWSGADFERSPDDDVPEIADADLTDTVLQVSVWGVTDPAELRWVDEPPLEHWNAGVETLQQLRALDGDRKPTKLGTALAGLPVPARVGALLVEAAGSGDEATFDRAIALASELVGGTATPARLRRLIARSGGGLRRSGSEGRPRSTGQLAAVAFPERIAARVGDDAGRYQLVSGVVATMSDEDPLRGSELVVALEIDGDRRAGRIFRAVPVTVQEVLDLGVSTETIRVPRRLPSGRIETVEHLRMGSAVLSVRVVAPTEEDVVTAVLADLDFDAVLNAGPVAVLRARIAFLRASDPDGSQDVDDLWPDWSVPTLAVTAEHWLGPALAGRDPKNPMRGLDIDALLRTQLSHRLRQRLDLEAPVHVAIPSGRAVSVDYLDAGGPTIEAKLQEFFGASTGPRIAKGRVAVRLVLLSPAGRPAAVIADLSAFWKSGYAAVRSDLRGRYPRHPWPEDPESAVATAKAKPRL